MEELFLRALLARDELDVVDQQKVDGPVAGAELGGPVVADRVDELVGEALGREVGDRHPGEEPRALVADGVEEMGLAEADPAVDEERVVGARWQLRHRLARGLRELVRGADDEGVEGIARVQPLGGAPRHGWAAGRRRRRALRRGLVHDDGDARVAAETLLRSVLERVEVVLDEPVSSLDVSIRSQILNLLKDLQGEFGISYLLISHDLATVEHMSDWIGVMYLGKLVEIGQAARVFAC